MSSKNYIKPTEIESDFLNKNKKTNCGDSEDNSACNHHLNLSPGRKTKPQNGRKII